ncbi:MAG: tRNA preQ1(34) S-adenosylmethionine ribosyltransferase-isomerase QueA [Deferribacteraceae bacterium]|jgi:S-adenosylmethionine:tRNA ribosyltransferase-isomerase|nr:tRNA preQ1(34) S-adenosylmethionine ribosyltransferase-isomerase QueA [Deferribacteraceae bacterium]
MKTELLEYPLPQELIAQYPPKERGDSRLLDYRTSTNSIADLAFKDIVNILDDRYFLILNDTFVIPARLWGVNENGAKREILFLSKRGEYEFKALIRGKVRVGGALFIGSCPIKIIELLEEGWLLRSELPVDMLIANLGQTALPPYIKRQAVPQDAARYQTVYADRDNGFNPSVAAPTAGLHFTEDILRQLTDIGVETVKVPLQVGVGTFRPIKSETVKQHTMHVEHYLITEESAEKANNLIDKQKLPLCIGTTTVRAVESAAAAVKQRYRLKGGIGRTDLFIVPGYTFKIAKALLTNFHLPRSSLLLLASAFTGLDELKSLYAHAVEKRYRFFSYGDAMLIR